MKPIEESLRGFLHNAEGLNLFEPCEGNCQNCEQCEVARDYKEIKAALLQAPADTPPNSAERGEEVLRMVVAAVAAEKERCARIAITFKTYSSFTSYGIADAIRATPTSFNETEAPQAILSATTTGESGDNSRGNFIASTPEPPATPSGEDVERATKLAFQLRDKHLLRSYANDIPDVTVRAWASDIAAEFAKVREAERERCGFNFREHLAHQREWSEKTFGPGDRAKGVVEHIRKELREIESQPNDLEEWIDVVILALDGAWRSGGTPNEIIGTLVGKQAKNEKREWPDWRTFTEGQAIEHIKSATPAREPAPEPPVTGVVNTYLLANLVKELRGNNGYIEDGIADQIEEIMRTAGPATNPDVILYKRADQPANAVGEKHCGLNDRMVAERIIQEVKEAEHRIDAIDAVKAVLKYVREQERTAVLLNSACECEVVHNIECPVGIELRKKRSNEKTTH